VATSRPAGSGLRHRLLRYAYSNRNLAGCACALGGLGLFFTGVVGELWPLVVGGLYGIGALVTPPTRGVDLHLGGAGLDAEALDRAMAEQVRRIRRKVPEDVLDAVVRIHDAVRDVLARREHLPPGSPDAFVVQRTVDDYLPNALEAYLSLPRGYANRVAVSGGRSARQVLLDQLALLERKLREVVEALVRGDTDRLLAHERFLADRFATSELTLDDRRELS